MGTTRKTITVTDQQDNWIKAQVAAGQFTNKIKEQNQGVSQLDFCLEQNQGVSQLDFCLGANKDMDILTNKLKNKRLPTPGAITPVAKRACAICKC